jgi:hypothetical protein
MPGSGVGVAVGLTIGSSLGYVATITAPTVDFGFVGYPTVIEATFTLGAPSAVEAHVNGAKVGDMIETAPGVWQYEWTPSAADSDAELTAVVGTFETAAVTIAVLIPAQQWILGEGTGDPLSVPSNVGGDAATAPSSGASPTLSEDDADFAGEDVLSFDGGDYLEGGATNSTEYIHDGTGGTLSLTFHTDDTSGLTYVYGQRLGGNGRGLQIGHDDGRLYFVLGNGTAQIAVFDFAAAVNTTHTLVWRLDGSVYTVWLDDPDTPIATDTCTAAPTEGAAAGKPTVGARSTGASPFIGKLGQVDLWDAALTDAQVAALMG